MLRRLAAIPGLSLLVSARGITVPDHLTFTHRPVLAPLGDADARALFREHAPSVAPGDPNLTPFLQALGGIPLAIYLIARLAEPFADLAELWDDYRRRGPELARHAHLPPDRLTSVFRSLDLSWRSPRLRDPGRALFRLLGLSPAGLCLDDRRALFGDEARAAAEQVLEVGLAFVRAGRLDLLPPVRGYAQSERKPTPAEEDRWCRHFLALAADEGAKLGAKGGGAAVARLGPEMPNVEAAFQAASEGERRAVAARAAHGYAEMVSFSDLGRPDPLHALAQACRRDEDKRGEANCMEGLGEIEHSEGRAEAACALYEQALALFGRIAEPYSIGVTRVRLAEATRGATRAAHVAAARAAWTSIDRPDLVALLDQFG